MAAEHQITEDKEMKKTTSQLNQECDEIEAAVPKKRYSDYIMEAVRQSLGLDKNDKSRDAEITEMDGGEIVKRYLEQNEIFDYTFSIIEVVSEAIFGFRGLFIWKPSSLCQNGPIMNILELIDALGDYRGDTPVVVFKDDEMFEIKKVSIERADGDHQSAVVIQI